MSTADASTARNTTLRRYIIGHAALAFGVLLIATAKLPGPTGAPWLAVAMLALYTVAGLAPVQLRLRSQGVQFAWGEAAVIIGLVVLPPSTMIWAAALGRLAAELIGRRPADKLTLNVAKQVVAVTAAATLSQLIAGTPVDPFTLRGVAALIAATAVYALIAALSVSIAISLANGTRLRLMPLHRVELIAISGNIAVAFLILAVLRFDPRLLFAIPPMIVFLRLTYAYRLRTHTEREAWQRLAAVTDRFSEVDLAQVLGTAVTGAAELFGADEVEVLVRLGSEPDGLVRGDAQGVSWAGAAADAPAADEAETIETPLGGQRDTDTDAGELRLRFRGTVRLSDRERYALQTFAAALGTALRNAYAYAEAQRRAARHAYDAAHDPLTGLANRRYLLDVGEQVLAERPTRGTQAMVLIDLDHFKEVNDTLGHSAGDEVLTTIGRRLATAAGDDDIVVRLGGDEFAVLFVALPAPALAVHRARQMLATLDPPIEVDGIRITVGGSAGVALAPVQGGVGELLRRTDVAMYQAKRDGSRLAQYARQRDTADIGRLALGGELRAALHGNQFALRYLPIVELNSGRISAAEALARWEHPYRGEMAPRQFLTAIERSDLLPEFTELVLDTALAAASEWAGAGHPIGVAVNLSPRSLLDPDFLRVVQRRVVASGVPPEQLTLELTETRNLSRLDVVDDTLRGLRELGVRIALDDFGTGSSSLGMLARVPVDELKIDRSFVAGLVTSPEPAAVVRAAIDLGRSLDLSVVAEGVESQRQRAMLFELGCPCGSGYLFSRPVTDTRIAELLAAEAPLAPPMSADAQVIRIPPGRLTRSARRRL
ncbi:hypothetical protein Athai_64480 [Actinocatenispora thailandica]|uniref:GGDEF-domain containing protein n=1 Tax=Actinocatenispora thailandica TaxID=227318 RepID=A0A7R7DWL3_9ACTN|nr:bifunctional diguanylate cyclase/phosphodiesterase [Actinocatenispora thailandica]BCJ38945.1 hypothetical protein Athai_64480 [Actinocatenispora thailandica]